MEQIFFNGESFSRVALDKSAVILPDTPDDVRIWIKLAESFDDSLLGALEPVLGIPKLLLRHLTNPSQQTRIETYGSTVVVIVNTPTVSKTSGILRSSSVALVLSGERIISFEPKSSTVFDELINELKNSPAGLRESGPEVLFCALIELLVDKLERVVTTLELDIEKSEGGFATAQGRVLEDEPYWLFSRLPKLFEWVMPLTPLMQRLTAVLSSEAEGYVRELVTRSQSLGFRVQAQHLKLQGILGTQSARVASLRKQSETATFTTLGILLGLTVLGVLWTMPFEFPLLSIWGAPLLALLTIGGYFWILRTKALV